MKNAIQIALFIFASPVFLAGILFELTAAAFLLGRDFITDFFAD